MNRVTDSAVKLNMESVERLIDAETAELRRQLQYAKDLHRVVCDDFTRHCDASYHRRNRDGKMMIVIGCGCGVFGVLAGFLIRGCL